LTAEQALVMIILMQPVTISLLTEPHFADFLDAVDRERDAADWRRLASFINDIQNNERAIWVASVESVIVGMVSVRWRSDYQGFTTSPVAAEIIDLYIWTDYRRQGIATHLMDHVEDVLRQQKYQRVGLSVGILTEDKPAWDLYLQRGYSFDNTGAWWQGTSVATLDNVDQTIAPVMLMMDKIL